METKAGTFCRAYLVFGYIPKGKRKPARAKIHLGDFPNTMTKEDAEALTIPARVKYWELAKPGNGFTSKPTGKPCITVYGGCDSSESEIAGRIIWEPLFPSFSMPLEV